jgi:glucose/arabinose dehydrogenase
MRGLFVTLLGTKALLHAFVTPLLLAGSPVPDSPLGCEPVRSETITPAGALTLPEGPGLEPSSVAGPFDQPRSVAFLPEGRYLVAERPGKLLLVVPGAPTREIGGTPPVLTAGHGGLVDIALDPGFAGNDTLYLSYLDGAESSSALKILKAKLDVVADKLAEQAVIFVGTPGTRTDQIGGRLAVTPDGHLFMSAGDRFLGDPAQDLADDAGSIIRIRTDGSIPDDNPFRGVAGARPEIWSYGHRNPQGLAFNPETGRLWSDEHGPQGGDELNLVLPGRNYGWPFTTYGVDYSGRPSGLGLTRDGLEQPVRYWVPLSIAPSGLAVEPGLSHETLWISTLGGQMLVRLSFGENCAAREEHFLKDRLGRIRDVRISPAGALYVLTDGDKGMLYRLDWATEDTAQAKARF